MKKYAKGLAGALLGTVGGLSLTLNFWGREPYQVFVALILGSLLGLYFADWRVAWEITKKIFERSTVIFCDLTKIEKKVRRKNRAKLLFKYRAILAINAIILLALVPGPIIITILSGLDTKLAKIEGGSLYFALSWTFLVLPLLFSLLAENGPETENYHNPIPAKLQTKIWGKIIPARAPIMKFSPRFSFLEMEKKIFLTKCLFAFLFYKQAIKIVWTFFKGVVWIIFMILVIAISTVTTAFLLPIWLVREASHHGNSLLILTSVVIGILLGTYLQSWIYGLSGTFVFFTIGYLLHWSKNFNPFRPYSLVADAHYSIAKILFK